WPATTSKPPSTLATIVTSGTALVAPSPQSTLAAKSSADALTSSDVKLATTTGPVEELSVTLGSVMPVRLVTAGATSPSSANANVCQTDELTSVALNLRAGSTVTVYWPTSP